MVKVRKDGRIQKKVRVVNPITGEKKVIYGYGYTEIDAITDRDNKANDYMNNLIYTPVTFKEWTEDWLHTKLANGEIAETTEESYRSNICNHILPNLPSGLKLSEFAVYHVKNILNNVKTSRTKQYTYTVLNNVLQDAVFEMRLENNPCALVRKPRHESVSAEVIEPKNFKELMEELRGSQMYYLMNFAFDTGARRGEICGAKWNEFSKTKAQIAIDGQIKKTRDKGEYYGKTKSKYGVRILPLTQDGVNNIETWRKLLHKKLFEAGLPWDDNGYVFRSEKNLTDHMPLTTVTNTFVRLRKTTGMDKKVRFHSFRHTQGTLLAEDDISPKKIQARLGHSSAAFTMQTYVHNSAAMQDGIVESLAKKQKPYRKK